MKYLFNDPPNRDTLLIWTCMVCGPFSVHSNGVWLCMYADTPVGTVQEQNLNILYRYIIPQCQQNVVCHCFHNILDCCIPYWFLEQASQFSCRIGSYSDCQQLLNDKSIKRHNCSFIVYCNDLIWRPPSNKRPLPQSGPLWMCFC